MKKLAQGFVLPIAVAGLMLLPRQGHAETIERQLEELRQMINQLQSVVKEQGREIESQRRIIRDLREQLTPSDETQEEPGAHLDKHLLHERSGLGEQLGNLRIGIALTGIVQGSVDAEDISEENRDRTDGSWSMDLEIESPIGEHGLGFILVEAGQGEGLTDELPVFHNVNDDAGDSESGLEVTEAWYEHSLLDERVALTVGKLDLTNYFDTNAVANDETTQFLNSGLVNSIATEFPEDNGPGVRLALYPVEWIDLGLGWAESDADWEDIVNDGFGIAQIGFRPNFAQREGNYRFYAWVNGADHEELTGDDTDEDGWGIGLSFDQQISNCLTGFLRAGYADEDVYAVEGTWSAGAEIRGTLWNRENDVLGLALSQAFLNDKLEDDDTETLLEAYYNIALNDQLAISPDIQIIDNPGGDSHNDTVVVLGTRAQVNF